MRFGLAKKGGRVSEGWEGVNMLGGGAGLARGSLMATGCLGGWKGEWGCWIEGVAWFEEKGWRREGWSGGESCFEEGGWIGAGLVGGGWIGGEGWFEDGGWRGVEGWNDDGGWFEEKGWRGKG